MKKNTKTRLIREFIEQGAYKEEASEFANLANDLSTVWNFDRPQKVKDNFLKQYNKKKYSFWQNYQRQFAYAIPLILILFLIFGTTVVKAQESKPGDVLYPVKLLSDKLYKQASNINQKKNENTLTKKDNKINIKQQDKNELNDSTNHVNGSMDKMEHSKAPKVLQRVKDVVPTQAQDAVENAEKKVRNIIQGQQSNIEPLPNTDDIKKDLSPVTLQ